MTQRYFWDSEGLQILAPSTEEELESIHLNGGCIELTPEVIILMLKAEEMINDLIDAWEALPCGRRYSALAVDRWLNHDMKKAIDKARDFLSRPRPEPVS